MSEFIGPTPVYPPNAPYTRVEALDGVTTPRSVWESRQKPRAAFAAALLEAQEGRCLYCGHPFGSTLYGDGGPERLKLNWDHFVPFAVLQANPYDNWVAACHVCNRIKRDQVYESLENARADINAKRNLLGFADPFEPLPERPDYANLPAEIPVALGPGYVDVSLKQIASFEDRLGKAARKADQGDVASAWIAVGRVQAEIRALTYSGPG